MDYLRKRFRFNYTEVDDRQKYAENWERTFRGKPEEPKEPPQLPVKFAADCSACECCEEPYCEECEMHYADCAHPGPDSE